MERSYFPIVFIVFNASRSERLSTRWLVCPSICTLAALACTPYAPGSEMLQQESEAATGQSATEADAGIQQLQAQAGADWSCLGEVVEGRSSVEDSFGGQEATVVYSLRLYDLRARTVVPEGLHGRACAVGDVLCEEPLDSVDTVDERGFLDFEVPRGFTGYFEALADGFVPVMDFPAAVEQDTLQFGYAMIPLSVVPQLAEVNQINLVADTAIVALTTADCQGVRAPGVVFTNDVGGLPFYFIDDFPRQGLTSTTLDGAGGFVNVPVGSVTARASLEEGLDLVRTRVLLTRPTWASYAHLTPPRAAPATLPDL